MTASFLCITIRALLTRSEDGFRPPPPPQRFLSYGLNLQLTFPKFPQGAVLLLRRIASLRRDGILVGGCPLSVQTRISEVSFHLILRVLHIEKKLSLQQKMESELV